MWSRGIAVVALIVSLLSPATARAASSPGQFVVRCRYSHTLADDPIVLPGQPGASHLHDFFGNVTANASSTLDSMLQGATTCRAASDTAGYWTPSASIEGEQVRPRVMRIYYLGTRGAAVRSLPPGIQIIGGNRYAASPEENPHVSWNCGETTAVQTPQMTTPYDCTPWASYHFVDGVVASIDLPNCWDGSGLHPEDVVYPVGGSCPPSNPIPLPRLSERLHLGVMDPLAPDGSVALKLSSGPYYTMHADFWNTWQQARLDQLVEDCLVRHLHCGSIDAEHEIDWTEQFGTARYDQANAAVPFADGVAVGGFTAYDLVPGGFHHRYDAFVRVLSGTGGETWTRQFGGPGNDEILAIASDGTDVFVAGWTDAGLPGQPWAGGADAFVARFGPQGRLVWLNEFGTPRDDEATGLIAGANGVFVVGASAGTLRGARSRGGEDAFVARFDREGTRRWVRQFGSTGADEATGIAGLGDQLIVVGQIASSTHGQDAFVASWSASGGLRWLRRFGGDAADLATGVAAGSGVAYVVGWTDGDAFTPGLGGRDAFLRAFDRTGRPLSGDRFGGSGDDVATSVGLGDAVYVGGWSTGSVFDEPSSGASDAFVSRFLRSGVHVWTERIGTTDNDWGYGLAVDPRGAYLVGTTHGGLAGATNAGDRDVFVAHVRFT